MKTIYLNGRAMRTREEAHDQIARALSFPAYYGRNLDALWDLLGETEADVTFGGTDAMLSALGEYGLRLLKVFYDADRDNPGFSFSVRADY